MKKEPAQKLSLGNTISIRGFLVINYIGGGS